MQRLVEEGYVHALSGGNALATHDLEGAMFHTALGQDIRTQQSMPNGHYNHLDTINRVWRSGSIAQFVDDYDLHDGIMHACAKKNIPFLLAGSIRDGGPLPETIEDVYESQHQIRVLSRMATTVICMATMLHTFATGNITPSYHVNEGGTVRPVCIYAVEASEFVVNKLHDRRSLGGKDDCDQRPGLHLHCGQGAWRDLGAARAADALRAAGAFRAADALQHKIDDMVLDCLARLRVLPLYEALHVLDARLPVEQCPNEELPLGADSGGVKRLPAHGEIPVRETLGCTNDLLHECVEAIADEQVFHRGIDDHQASRRKLPRPAQVVDVLLAHIVFLVIDCLLEKRAAGILGCCHGGCDNAAKLQVAAAFIVDANGRIGYQHIRHPRLLCVAHGVIAMCVRPLV
ncbi:MAG: hypothetical protein LKK29_04960 [Olsenella sp.]|nr:hypothetical protein [Olsenella sp.]